MTLTVWTFNSTGAADDALPVLARLVSEGAVVVEDAAVVSWPEGRRKPSGRPVKDVFGEGMLWDGTWGMILGMIFLVPIAGPSFGAAAGAFAGALWNLGLDDNFVKSVRDTVTPGTSALFALCGDDAASRLTGELHGQDVGLIQSRLSHEQQLRIRETMGKETERPRPGR